MSKCLLGEYEEERKRRRREKIEGVFVPRLQPPSCCSIVQDLLIVLFEAAIQYCTLPSHVKCIAIDCQVTLKQQ